MTSGGTCARVRPTLYRVVEGEASPEEALLTARHLTDCTGCRILMARERRLAQMLDRRPDERLHADEALVMAVMARLPCTPPPQPRRARGLRARAIRRSLARR